MTQPQQSFPGFQPTGDFAISAQRGEIESLREQRDSLQDRVTYLTACLAQHMAESQQQIAELAAQLSNALSNRDMDRAFNPPTTWAEGDTSDDGVDAELPAIDPADRLIDASLVPGD
jgi:hypothetical protein